jgi:hypothetical protein
MAGLTVGSTWSRMTPKAGLGGLGEARNFRTRMCHVMPRKPVRHQGYASDCFRPIGRSLVVAIAATAAMGPRVVLAQRREGMRRIDIAASQQAKPPAPRLLFPRLSISGPAGLVLAYMAAVNAAVPSERIHRATVHRIQFVVGKFADFAHSRRVRVRVHGSLPDCDAALCRSHSG